MYLEKKTIHGKPYWYARVSARKGETVKTKTLAYLGKGPLTKKEAQQKMNALPNIKVEEAKKALQESFEDRNSLFFSPEQMKRLENIKKAFAEKLKLKDQQLKEDMFKDFKTYYIYNTNAIEGNTLTLAETQRLLNEGKTPEGKDLREIYDHINEKDTFDYLLETQPEITIEVIIDIHKRLLKNIDKRVGSFRSHNVRVFGATFETTDAKYVAADMGLLLQWYRKERRQLHPLIVAAIFHEKFERIHPFYDGNGRTGRMILNIIVLRAGFPPLIVKHKDRKQYYQVLDAGHHADLTKTDRECYKPIVHFCYQQLVETFEKIFAKWG